MKYAFPRKRFFLLLALFLGSLSLPTLAEQKQIFGEYEVHYSVFPSSFIPQETAAVHNITRASNRMVLNISLRRSTPDDELNETVAVAAQVTGSRHDLMRPIDLNFREVTEPGAIYYLADFLAINEELSRFNIKVTLDSGKELDLEFVKTLYIDP